VGAALPQRELCSAAAYRRIASELLQTATRTSALARSTAGVAVANGNTYYIVRLTITDISSMCMIVQQSRHSCKRYRIERYNSR
jgi:hypothetical protein